MYPTQPQQEKDCEVGEFTAISVSDNLQVVLQEGACAVKLVSDEALLPYILVSVRDSILYIEYDEKAVPRDVKKVYRGKNAPVPVMQAQVSSPFLNGILASQNAVISGKGTIFSDTMDMMLTDKATVKDLKVDAESAILHMGKNSVADFTLSIESQLELSLEGSSELKLQYKSRNLLLHQEGNTTAILQGESSTATYGISGFAKNRSTGKGNVLVVEAGGNADVSLAGEMGDLTLSLERTSRVDAVELKASRVKVSQNGWNSATVHAEDFLSVNLTGGSTLHYSGIPAIQVDKIMKSSFVHIEENE
ncbi:MAG: DUF2807 domain-containing protein [Bacteroidales bacterium]|nr:DUF2807 domain-containing protein [Bacteroidales bacterium]